MQEQSPNLDSIMQTNCSGAENWSARDLMKILGYARWENFKNAIERAEEACKNSGQMVDNHFLQAEKMINTGKGAQRPVQDYLLSRFACYLIARAPVTGHQSQRDQRSRLLWERRLLSA